MAELAHDRTPRRWDGSPVDLPGWQASVFENPIGPALYYVTGPNNGHDLLLLPGMNAAWFGFMPVLASLSTRFRVTAPDLRGHGFSGRASGRQYQVVDYVQDICALVKASFPDGVVIAGNSLGALVAAGVAAELPSFVRGVVLEDGPFFITERARWSDHPLRRAVFGELAERLQRRDLENQSLATFHDHYAKRPFGFMPTGDLRTRLAFVYRFSHALAPLLDSYTTQERTSLDKALTAMLGNAPVTWGDLFPAAVIAAAAARYFHVDAAVAAAGAREDFSIGFEHEAILRKVTCPTLILEADRELVGMLTGSDIDRLKASIGSRVLSHSHVQGAGHEIHQSHSAQYAAEVLSLFGR